MTFHILKEDSIAPTTRKINVRSLLDTSGPHLLTGGHRTVIADLADSGLFYRMTFRYEFPNGEMRSIRPDDLALDSTTQAGGGIWYMDNVLILDKYWPAADGPYSEERYGIFSIDFALLGGTSNGISRISYDIVLQVFDGSSSVQYHPAL